MIKHKIEFTPILFKVSLRNHFDLNALIIMSEDARNSILPCLSVAQIKRFYDQKAQLEKEKKAKGRDEKLNVEAEHLPHLRNLKGFNQPEGPKEKFHLPEYVTCSICGDYTNEWVTFNPNKCRKCLEKIYKKNTE